MIPLFSKNSLTVLESLSFTKTLYAFDFDGTLAKIVRVPSAAHMASTTENLLKELSSLAPVAVISGRSIKDLKQRIGFRPHFLVGNHGLEGLGESKDSLAQARKVCSNWRDRLNAISFEPGIEVEEKTYSIALHYRRSRNKKLSRSQIQSAIDLLRPSPRIITGKSVYNLLPPGSPHKGAAMLDLMQKCSAKHALYVGDDDTDEDVFSMPYTGGQLMTVRVGKKRSSSASYYIDRQGDMSRLLKLLIAFHRPSRRNHAPETRL